MSEEQTIPAILKVNKEEADKQLQTFFERLKQPYKKYVLQARQIKPKGRLYSHLTPESFVYAMHERDGAIKLPIYRIVAEASNQGGELDKDVGIFYFFESQRLDKESESVRAERHFFHQTFGSKGIGSHSALIEAYIKRKDLACETRGLDMLLTLLFRSW